MDGCRLLWIVSDVLFILNCFGLLWATEDRCFCVVEVNLRQGNIGYPNPIAIAEDKRQKRVLPCAYCLKNLTL